MCPPLGWGKVPAPPGFSGRIWAAAERKWGPRRSPAQRVRWGEEEQRNERVFALLGGNEGYGACDDDEQEKALTLLCARAATTSRSAGGFRGAELTLFPRSKGDLDADIGKKPRIRRFDRIRGDAVLRKEKFSEMKEEKSRHTIWLTDNAWELVEERYQKDNCSTKNEYIEKAIRFYSGYLDAEGADEYLPGYWLRCWKGSWMPSGNGSAARCSNRRWTKT